jgi:hypothetical protein
LNVGILNCEGRDLSPACLNNKEKYGGFYFYTAGEFGVKQSEGEEINAEIGETHLMDLLLKKIEIWDGSTFWKYIQKKLRISIFNILLFRKYENK